MTTAANNEKKNTMTSKVSARTVARHIKTMVHSIEKYNVEVRTDVLASVTITPKDGDAIHCVGDLVRIAEAYKCGYYVGIIENRVEFVIY